MAENKDVGVGYKRPPRELRFRAGTSGNPGGRPRSNLPSLRSQLEAELAEDITVHEEGRKLTVSKQRAIANKIVAAALRGDMRATAAVIALTRIDPADEQSKSDASDRAALHRYVEDEVARRVTELTKGKSIA